MLVAAIGLLVQQTVSARVVEMSATLGGKPYGTVLYVRQLVPGKGMERSVTLTVQEEGAEYRVEEKRAFGHGGVPTSIVRTYTEGTRKAVVSVTFSGLKAVVTVSENGEQETEEVPLEVEGATTTDPTQFWFFGSAPPVKESATFWEYSLDENAWVERKVRYEGLASLKVGEKTVQAHRVSIGETVNVYVDEFGMPYKSVQKTDSGDLVLVRTKPEVSP
jgi:hypothetical protein